MILPLGVSLSAAATAAGEELEALAAAAAADMGEPSLSWASAAAAAAELARMETGSLVPPMGDLGEEAEECDPGEAHMIMVRADWPTHSNEALTARTSSNTESGLALPLFLFFVFSDFSLIRNFRIRKSPFSYKPRKQKRWNAMEHNHLGCTNGTIK